MISLAEWLEATALASFLKQSRWVYPLVNAGHILGIALLVGAVLPMDLRVLRRRPPLDRALRPWAVAGLVLAAACGILLFVTQATDYVASPWFLAKMAVLAAALVNAGLFLVLGTRILAAVSLAVWPLVLILGRMIAYG